MDAVQPDYPMEEEVEVELRERQDLATLHYLDNEILLQCLRERFESDVFYTYIGDSLVAVNPCKILDIYDEKHHSQYADLRVRSRHEPHIFWVADHTYRELVERGETQCVVVSGDSGAGKTESTKLVLSHLVHISNSASSDLVDRLEQVNPLLELFGNAATELNQNSSRFGKLVELEYNRQGDLLSSKLECFILEKFRVTSKSAHEKNFHIFYALFAGMSPSELQDTYHLEQATQYRILSSPEEPSEVFPSPERREHYRQQYHDLLRMLELAGFSDEERQHLIEVLVVVLFVSNVQFVPDEEEYAQLDELSEHNASLAADFLGIDEEKLRDALLVLTTTAGNNYPIQRKKSVRDAEAGRDALARELYSSLFYGIIDKINGRLAASHRRDSRHHSSSERLYIRLLDISGFEKVTHNGFEQLLINAANERLHQYFLQHALQAEVQDYEREGVSIRPVDYSNNQDVMDLIFKRPYGLLPLMEEELSVPKTTDHTFLAKVERHCRENPCFVTRAKSGHVLQFSIRHYAGEVVYSAHRFLEKNRETLANNLKQVVDESENIFVKQYFLLDSQTTIARNSGGRGSLRGQRRGAKGVATPFSSSSSSQTGKLTGRVTERFVWSLNHMMSKLREARPVFVRCIKPNVELRPGRFNAETVRSQLESSGVLAVTQIRRAGFPLRLPLRQFCRRYFPIVSEEEPPSNRNTADGILAAAGITEHDFGHTKVFLKTEHRDTLERVMLEKVAARQAAAREAERASKMAESEGESELGVGDSGLDDSLSMADSHGTPRTGEAWGSRAGHQVRGGRARGKGRGASSGTGSKEDGDGKDDEQKETEEEESKAKEKEETEINMPAYDVFRNTELESGSGHEFETKVIRAVRFVLYMVLTSLVLGASVIGRVTLQWLTQSLLSAPRDAREGEASCNDVTVMMMLVLVIPVLFTWLRSLIKALFGRKRWAKCGVLFLVCFLDLVQAVGRFLFVFRVLPVLGRLQAVVAGFAVCLVPALLKAVTHLFAQRHRGKGSNLDPEKDKGDSQAEVAHSDTSSDKEEQDSSLAKRVLFSIGIVLAVIVEIGAVVSVVLQKYLQSMASTQLSKVGAEAVRSDFQQHLLWALPLSVLCISTGWWDGFAVGTLRIRDRVYHLSRYRKGLGQIRETSTIYSGPLQLALLVTLTLVATPTELGSVDVPGFFISYGESFVQISFLAHLQRYGLLYIILLASYLASTAGIIACRLHMQRFAFAVPITLAPLGVLLVTVFCTVPGQGWDLTTRFSTSLNLTTGDCVCIGVTLALLLAGLAINMHIWRPQCERMAKLDRMFTQPPLDPLFPDLSLALRRRHDPQHVIREQRRLEEDREKVEVHICATMWHETRQEMIQILKSLFRIDFDHCARRMAARNFALSDTLELEDMYHPEIHIIFDDAFTNDPKTKQRVTNSWVKQLLTLIPEAVASVAKGNVEMAPPKLHPTPHGGRISYIMPGGTTLNVHLKDKDKMRHRKRWSQIMYLYYILGFRLLKSYKNAKKLLMDPDKAGKKMKKVRHFPSLLNKLPSEVVQKAERTFLMALDGDVDFRPDAVRLLIDRMKKNKKVAAVCGRIHPIGDGPMVWYQQFEYAVGHWLQKAAEHVFGCVLCCPGCFSLFRGSALMDDNVMKMYTTEPTEARHYIQYEQGEDRWLCTLLLQQGWKIDYCAGADSFTYAPETFNDFYIQRRRWAPSTMANIMDLIGSFRTTVYMNDNISTPFMLYQFVLMASSILAPGTIVFMIAGSYNAVLGLDMWKSYLLSVVPVAFYVLLCLKAPTKVQISVAAVMSAIYSIVMMLVTVGTLINIVNEDFYTPNVLFLVGMVGIFIVTGVCHPKEIYCLIHGILYYITVPSTFVFLTVFFLCNLNVVTWGTREGPKKVDPEQQQQQQEQQQKQAKRGMIGKIIDSLGIAAVLDDLKTFIRQMLGQRLQQEQQQSQQQQQQQQQRQRQTPLRRPSAMPNAASKPAEEKVVLDPEAWAKEVATEPSQIADLADEERLFWEWLIKKYLSPILPDKEKEERIKNDLISARNNVVFAYFLINLMFTLVIFFLQMKKDILQDTFYINGKYEPLSVVFLSVFACLLILQFLAMLVHRWGTLLHLVASAHINWFRKSDEEEKIRMALEEARRLQSEDPNPDYDSDDDDDDETPDTTPSQTFRGRASGALGIIAEEPDYSDDEAEASSPAAEPHSGGDVPYYERQFNRRFQTMRRQVHRRQSQDISRRLFAPTMRQRRQSIRSDLYQTVSRHQDHGNGYSDFSREPLRQPGGSHVGGAHYYGSRRTQQYHGDNPGYGNGRSGGGPGRDQSPSAHYLGTQAYPNPAYRYD